MTTDPYVAAVAARLTGLPEPVRRQALDDLRAVLAEGVRPVDLGSADSYAAELCADLAADSGPGAAEGAVFGVPYETRGAGDAGVRSRIWAPQDPRIVVPRLLGAGWTVNLGAVAVRLGLRPDDWDEQSHEAVPAAMIAVWRAVPAVFAAVAVAGSAVVARRRRRVPARWSGAVATDWVDARWSALPAAAAVAAAVWGALPTAGDDRFVRPALAGYAAAMGAGTVAAMAAARDDGVSQPGVPAIAVGLPVAVLVAMVAAPVTVAVRATWRGRAVRS